MEKKNSGGAGGCGILTVIQIVFIILNQPYFEDIKLFNFQNV